MKLRNAETLAEFDITTCVQIIDIHWTKQSKEPHFAAQRNRVPKAFPLGQIPAKLEAGVLLSQIDFRESHGFEVAWNNRTEFKDSEILKAEFGAHVRFRAKHSIFGIDFGAWSQPKRRPIACTMPIPTNSYRQIVWNSRYAYYTEWSYCHTTVNIGRYDLSKSYPFVGEPESIKSMLARITYA